MKRLVLILLLSLPLALLSQKSNTGTEFWTGFLRNYDSTFSGRKDSLRLYISATNKTKVDISIPLQGYSASIQIPKDSVVVFLIPLHLGYLTDYDVIRDKAIHITSDFPISVSAMNLLYATTDASIVLPYANIPSKTTYVVGNPSTGSTSEILLVAGEDSTKVKIIPTNTTLSGNASNVPIYLTLNKGQLYQMGSSKDLSGSIVSVLSPNKLVLFTGDRCSAWPCGACDHEFEQVLPNDVLDTAYCIPSHFGHIKGYLLKMIPLDSSTDIRVNGVLYKNVSRLNPLTIDVKSDSGYYASSNKLFHCHQFLKGAGCSGYINSSYGDPAQLELVSIKYFGESSLFSTVNSFNLKDHFVNIVIKTSAKNNVYLDKTKIDSSEFIKFAYAPTYSFARLKISIGQHLLESSDGLLAYCYGVGYYESYLYLSGFSLPNFDLAFKDSVLKYDCKNNQINVQFRAKSDKVLKKYTWYFGDNSSATGNPVQHLYNSTGNYTVKLVAEDFAGKKDSVTRIVIVNWPVFDPLRNKIICGIDTVLFQEKNPFFSNFKWQDNSTNNYYKAWDNKKVWVSATDTSGYCKFSDTATVSKIDIFSTLVVDSIEKCWKYNRFKFEDSTKILSDQILHKAWVFPWTTVWDKDQTTVRFPMPGKYKVYFDVYTTQANCKARYPINVTVHPMPKVFAKVKGENFCSGTPIEFYDSSQIVTGSIKSVRWVFDDTTSVNSDSLKTIKSLNYYQSNSDVVRFYKHIAISDRGCSDTVINAVQIWPKPKVDFLLNSIDTIQCLPSARWTYTSISTVAADTMNLFWDAGNGRSSTNYSMKNIRYFSAGRYTVSLKAVSTFGCEEIKIKHVEVLDIPKAQFKINDSTQCFKDHLFKFKDTTLGNYLSYKWDLGNGQTSQKASIDSVYYTTVGSYKVKLKISAPYNGCEDSTMRMVYVLKAPIAAFKINNDTQCLNSNSFTVNNQSTYFQNYAGTQWRYKNTIDTNYNLNNIVFTDTGRHIYSLRVIDNEGCTDSSTFNLQVGGQPAPQFTVNDSIQCLNGNRFVFRTSNPKGIINYWRIDGQLVYTGSVDSTIYISSTSGIHTIQLIQSTTAQCKDSLSKRYFILPAPLANFIINKDTQCFTGHGFAFSDASTANNDKVNIWTYKIGIQTYNGNANLGNIKFANAGIYLVQLKIRTKEGCADSITKNVAVLNNPVAQIIGDTVCLYEMATIQGLQKSGAPIQNWDWQLGDGFSGNNQQLQHLYAVAQAYDLSLTVTDNKGCTSTANATNAVLVHALPDASFMFQETGDGVSASRIKFLPILQTGNAYFWRFPNQQSSNLDTPVLIVTELLKGKITLRVSNAFNCTDSSEQSIYIYPNNFNVYIPTAITINNDQINDVFKIEGLKNTQNFEMQILNRWGETLFVSHDPNLGWDGYYKGELVQDGVYMYQINFTYYDRKTYQFSGTLTLLK